MIIKVNDMYKDEIENQIKRFPDMSATIRGIFKFALQHAEERPKLKPVDLSVLVDSEIDCEFGSEAGLLIGPLTAITGFEKAENVYHSLGGHWGRQCRPRMNHIHAFHNDFRLPEGLVVRVHFIDGTGKRRTKVYPSDKDPIRETSAENGIVSFVVGVEVLELADNFCWPWEAQSNGSA